MVLHVYLRNDVFLGRWCRLRTHKHSVIYVAAFPAALQELLQGAKPPADQVDVLKERGDTTASEFPLRSCAFVWLSVGPAI